MLDPDLAERMLPLLSLSIGMIMEDEVDGALTLLPAAAEARSERFQALAQAGRDIAALAEAADVLLRRSR